MRVVYQLEDQRFTGIDRVRYVGITEDVYSRFTQHLRGDENIEKNIWIEELKANNVMLVMTTIESVNIADKEQELRVAKELEQKYIRHYLEQGAKLFNIHITKSITFDDFMSHFCRTTTPVQTLLQRPSSTKRGAYAMTKAAVAELKKCSIRDVDTALSNGDLKPYAKDTTKILVSSVHTWTVKRRPGPKPKTA